MRATVKANGPSAARKNPPWLSGVLRFVATVAAPTAAAGAAAALANGPIAAAGLIAVTLVIGLGLRRWLVLRRAAWTAGPAWPMGHLRDATFAVAGLVAGWAAAVLVSVQLGSRVEQMLYGQLLQSAALPASLLLGVCILLTVSGSAWLLPAALARRRCAGRVGAAPAADVLWFGALWLVLAAGVAVLESSASDVAKTLVALSFAGGAATAIYAAVRLGAAEPSDERACPLVLALADAASPQVRHVLSDLSRRWTAGPVTWIVPLGAALHGEHAALLRSTRQLGTLRLERLYRLNEWQDGLPPPERWRSLPQREIHPANDLVREVASRLVGSNAAIVVLTSDAATVQPWQAALPGVRLAFGWLGDADGPDTAAPVHRLLGRDRKQTRDAMLEHLLASFAPPPDPPRDPAIDDPDQDLDTPPEGESAGAGAVLLNGRDIALAAWSLDGAQLATAAVDGTVQLWGASSGKPIGKPLAHDGQVQDLAFAPDGHTLLATGAHGTVTSLDVVTGTRTETTLRHGSGPVGRVAVSPDGRRIVTAGWDRTARIWDATDRSALGKPLLHDDVVTSAVFSADGRWIVTASWYQSACVWNVDDGTRACEPLRSPGKVNDVAFSPDADLVAVAGSDGVVHLWRWREGSNELPPLRHGSAVLSAAFMPNGQRLMTVSRDGCLRFWDVATATVLTTLREHEMPITSAALAPDGCRVAMVRSDGSVHIGQAGDR